MIFNGCAPYSTPFKHLQTSIYCRCISKRGHPWSLAQQYGIWVSSSLLVQAPRPISNITRARVKGCCGHEGARLDGQPVPLGPKCTPPHAKGLQASCRRNKKEVSTSMILRELPMLRPFNSRMRVEGCELSTESGMMAQRISHLCCCPLLAV